jgi:hypothetical protein
MQDAERGVMASRYWWVGTASGREICLEGSVRLLLGKKVLTSGQINCPALMQRVGVLSSIRLHPFRDLKS